MSDDPSRSPRQTDRKHPVSQDEQPQDPTDALEEALERVEAADGDGRIARVKAEEEAADRLCSTLADDESTPGRYLEEFVAETGYNKTELRELVESYREGDENDRPDLRRYIEENLVEIEAIRSTDRRQDTRYKWNFGEFVVRTGATEGEKTHFSADGFAKLIAGEGECYPDTSRYEGKDSIDWRGVVNDFIIGRPVEHEFIGPLTTAVNEIKDFIGTTPAYGTPEVALERRGIYLPGEESPGVDSDDVPEWRDRDRWVPSQVVMNICDEYEISNANELLMELDARELTVGWNRGASYETFVDGIRQTFWILNAETPDPVSFEADPPSPAEHVRDRIAEEDAQKQSQSQAQADGPTEATDETGDTETKGVDALKPHSPKKRAVNPNLREGTNGEDGGDDE